MRYTTVIDISLIPELYKNLNIRLVYLHLVLKAGYHDNDKDIVVTSLRRLANDAGLTVSATRHALRMLKRYQMVNIGKGAMAVRKWCPEQPISTRAKQAKQQQQMDRDQAAAAERRAMAKKHREDQRFAEELKANNKSSLDVYKDKLREDAAHGDAWAAERLKQLGG